MKVHRQHYYSPEKEYSALYEASEGKGQNIVTMIGATTNHNDIRGNFYAYLKVCLKGQDYKVYIGNVRLWIPRYRAYTHPDVMVTTGGSLDDGSDSDSIKNPLLIAEVISKSDEESEPKSKFNYYRSIPELKEYILIDQDKFHVEHFAKTSEGKWLLTEYESVDTAFTLSTIDIQIQLSEIYEGINFGGDKE